MAGSDKPVRLLIVDDSAISRRSVTEIFERRSDIEIVGKAVNGEEALIMLQTLSPDVITLDLEMPRMDGFTFLRFLMARKPTPVVVVSSYRQKENVFRALELGAVDFCAKPDRVMEGELTKFHDELFRKIVLAHSVNVARMAALSRTPVAKSASLPPAPPVRSIIPPRNVVAIASSTGGPNALMEIFGELQENSKHAVLVAQHMPEKFTRTFSERLNRRGPLVVSEAQNNDHVVQGAGFVCPGGYCMELETNLKGVLRLKISPPAPEDRYVPSADRLLASTARSVGRRAVGVILTGMGDDGVAGARAILEAGGTVIAESEESAIVYGMPGAAVRAGVVTKSLALKEIAEFIRNL